MAWGKAGDAKGGNSTKSMKDFRGMSAGAMLMYIEEKDKSDQQLLSKIKAQDNGKRNTTKQINNTTVQNKATQYSANAEAVNCQMSTVKCQMSSVNAVQ